MRAPVAIVGIGCRFPGGVGDPESFWTLLREARHAVSEIPRDRIDLERYFDPRPATPGRIMTRWGGFLESIDALDAAFFGISPREAERLDPQQRLLLETAWEALEDAGQDVRALDGSHTAVYVGQWASDFEARLFADPEEVDFYMTLGSGRYAASGRLSYTFGLRGPSVTIDTACSSSLVAVHLAVSSIREGTCDLALVGGANVILQPHVTIAYSQSHMMAPDGRCKFGDAAGDGYVRSEGAGVVVLKALERALADGDRVYAVIRGSSVNNDGRSSGSMGTPARGGQEELLRSAHRDAGVRACDVGYVEAHGTGTRTGDPIELGALGTVLAEGRPPSRRAFVGSVKTNFGHTEAAAGVAGLIKTALALHHATIPPSLHLREPNPAVAWGEVPLTIPTSPTPWPKGDGPRIAGVSAFGIAGTNAHVVLEEAAPPKGARDPSPTPGRATALLALSAKCPEALRALATRYADLLAREGAPDLHDVCFAAATRRTALEHRAVFLGVDRGTMVDSLRRYGAGERAHVEGVSRGEKPKIAFVLPGQGAQWHGMARQLLAQEPVFLEALQRCDLAARRYCDWSILEQLQAEPGTPAYLLERIDVIQPVLVALAIGYAALWRSLGVEPDAVVGHSMGEVAAAFLAGALDLDEAMHVICRRSALMRRASGNGAMALVELSLDECRSRIAGREERISVAVSNSPRSSVLSGEPAAVNEVLAELERDQVFCRLVKVDVASHSPQMEPLAAELAAELSALSPRAATIAICSTVLGRRVEGHELGAGYWARNLRQPVLFTSAVTRLLEDGVTVFIELGPHPVLLPAVEQTAQASSRAVTTVASARRDEPEQAAMLAGLGAVWAAGAPVAWKAVLPTGRDVRLPLYPWQRERHWVEAAEIGRAGPRDGGADVRPDDESLGWLHRLEWEPSDPPPARSASAWLVAAADGAAGAAIATALRAAGSRAETAPLDRLEAALHERCAAGDALHGVILVTEDGPDAPYLPVRALQALLAPEWASRPRLWFVTRGSQSVDARPATRVAVDQAALWGAARVVAEEHPELWGGLVDLDPAVAVASGAALLARHLLAADGEDQVSFRGAQRFALRLARLERTGPPAPFAWRKDAAYLVTGGLGDLGLHVARAMVARGVRRLVLLGRTPLPPRQEWTRIAPETPAGKRIAAVRALEASGAAVHVAAVDVSDEARLRAFLDRYAAEGWPPIRGVVHAAATLDNHLAGVMERRSFDAALLPKLRGAQLLDRLLPDLDVFVLFSSVVAFLAQPGEANYAAANAGLDALAHDRRARGLPALSIAWGVWTDTGFAKGEAGERVATELGRQGIRGFSPGRGTSLFGWLCGRSEAGVAVLPIDWDAFRRARTGRGIQLYRKLLTCLGADGAQESLRARLEGAVPAERRRILEEVVKESVGKVLKISPARLDPRKALGALGLSSLLAMELRNRLEAALGRSLSATLAWNYPTVAALTEYLARRDDDAAAPPQLDAVAATDAAAADHPDDLGRIAELSDEEAVLALRAGRPRGPA